MSSLRCTICCTNYPLDKEKYGTCRRCSHRTWPNPYEEPDEEFGVNPARDAWIDTEVTRFGEWLDTVTGDDFVEFQRGL